MAYTEWGAPDNPRVVVCVHGLTRNGRDFDDLAQALADDFRVVCPDVVGRGRSDWLAVKTDYGFPLYVADMITLIARLNVEQVSWVGTSMGGIIGMLVASQPHTPISRLVLNDVGPVIQWQALQRIGEYLGDTGHFDSIEEAADAMWAVSTTFGRHTPAQWLALSTPMVRALPDGGFTLHYDPAIAVPFSGVTAESAAAGEAGLWQLYDRVTARTLLLRGAASDLLSVSTAQAMTERGPRARLVEFPGVGHAPTLVSDDQVTAVTSFLLEA